MLSGWPLSHAYILQDGEPVQTPDFVVWARWHTAAARSGAAVVGRSRPRHGVEVSTVFLGLDQRVNGAGPPILWETAIFGGPHAGYRRQYTNRADAEAGHRDAVALAKGNRARRV